MNCKHPQLTSAKGIYRRKYRDRNPGDLTFEDFLVLTQQPCFYCNAPPSNAYNEFKHARSALPETIANGTYRYNGLDRVDNAKGHDLDNLVPCCSMCNFAKRHHSQEHFMLWIQKAHSNLLKTGKIQ